MIVEVGKKWIVDVASLSPFSPYRKQSPPLTMEGDPSTIGATVERLLLTTREAAETLAVSESTVRTLVRSGSLEIVRIGGIQRISAASVRTLAGEPTPT